MSKLLNKLSFWWVGIVAMAIGIFAAGGSFLYTSPDGATGNIKRSDLFSLRVKEGSTFDANYYYIIQTAEKGAWFWRDIYTIHCDHSIKGESEKIINVVKDDTGYISLGTVTAVTTDSGGSWTFFDTRGSQFAEINRAYWLNKTKINADGTGTISLDDLENTSRRTPVFTTTDYGKTWTETMP